MRHDKDKLNVKRGGPSHRDQGEQASPKLLGSGDAYAYAVKGILQDIKEGNVKSHDSFLGVQKQNIDGIALVSSSHLKKGK